MKYDSHSDVLNLLASDQEAEKDLRDQVDEDVAFIHHPQGQWEPSVWNEYSGRPRYTFDQCKPAISRVWAEMAANDYSASTQPTGGGASKEVSTIIDGLIRRINNVSCFDDISTKAGKRMIATGFGCWRNISKYADSNSFYQDLAREPVSNAHRRVWFDCESEMQTREDSNHAFILSNKGIKSCESEWPKKERFESLSDGRESNNYEYKKSDNVIVGEILYKKRVKKIIYLLDDDDGTVLDEVSAEKLGINLDGNPSIIDTRETESIEVWSRKFDNHGWLDEASKTPFNMIPLIPIYANFDVTEDGKVTFFGLIRQVLDACRVSNYAKSRLVEDSVLGGRAKLMTDDRIVAGYEDEFSNINRTPSAVQLYNGAAADEVAKSGRQPFVPIPGGQGNPAVSELAALMDMNIQLILGLPNEMENLQSTKKDSDYRFEQRSSMGQVGTFEYYRAYKVGLEHTCKIDLGAIPVIYDTFRKITIIDEAGQTSDEDINKANPEGGELMNSLATGKYDVCVKIGAAFESRQADANSKILELGSINPDVVIRNTDIIASNIDAPGMKTVADRERANAMKMGFIPESQFTEAEAQQAQAAAQAAAAQGQKRDPMEVAAEAEVSKAQAQNDKVQVELLIQQSKLEQQQASNQFKAEKEAMEMELKVKAQEIDDLKKMVETAKMMQEMDSVGQQAQGAMVVDQQQEILQGGQ